MRRLKKLSKRSRTSGLLAGCLAAVALLATASAASAATYRPTRTDDPAPNGCKKKNCSLREAVIAGNDPAAGGDDRASPRQALRAHPEGRRRGRRPDRGPRRARVHRGQDQGTARRSGDDRRQRHRPHLRGLADSGSSHLARWAARVASGRQRQWRSDSRPPRASPTAASSRTPPTVAAAPSSSAAVRARSAGPRSRATRPWRRRGRVLPPGVQRPREPLRIQEKPGHEQQRRRGRRRDLQLLRRAAQTLVYRRQLRQGRRGRDLQPGIDHPTGGDHARSERVGVGVVMYGSTARRQPSPGFRRRTGPRRWLHRDVFLSTISGNSTTASGGGIGINAPSAGANGDP